MGFCRETMDDDRPFSKYYGKTLEDYWKTMAISKDYGKTIKDKDYERQRLIIDDSLHFEDQLLIFQSLQRINISSKSRNFLYKD